MKTPQRREGRRGETFAEIRPIPAEHSAPKKRKLGRLTGKIRLEDDFFAADKNLERDFLGEKGSR